MVIHRHLSSGVNGRRQDRSSEDDQFSLLLNHTLSVCVSVHTGAKKLDVQRILSHAVVGRTGEDGVIQRCAHIYNGQNAGVDGTFL